MIIQRKSLFVFSAAIAVMFLLFLAIFSSALAEKTFPPSSEEAEDLELPDRTERSIQEAVRRKLKGTEYEEPEPEPPQDDRPPMGKWDDTPPEAEYAAGGRHRRQSNTGEPTNEIKPKPPTACEMNPRSHECIQEKKATEAAEKQEDANINRTTSDTRSYGLIADRFELSMNEWACAATGNPLFSVSGDRDIVHYVARLISHAFLDQGQHYGSNIVLEYHTAQDQMKQAGHVVPHDCNLTAIGEKSAFTAVTDALLTHKEMMFKWIEANEVDSSPILAAYIPETRSIIKKWTLGRLMYKFGQCLEKSGPTEAEQHAAIKDCPVRNNEMILALLPIHRDENAPLDECQAGGQLMSMIDTTREGTVFREVSRMLDQCYEQGKLSDDPIEYGETLRKSGRDVQARELFELAIQRGKLCNIWQRPEEHHRKDITAAPVWTEESFPALRYIGKELRTMLGKYEAEESFNWTDMSGMQPVMRAGFIQRTWIFGNHQLNEKWVNLLSASEIVKLKKAIEEIKTSNDAYDWGCNGSIVIELWRISGSGAQSDKIVGSTNLVLQHLSPIRGDRRIVFQIGEDTAQIDPSDLEDNLVFDDSYEHRFFFEGVTPVAADHAGKAVVGGADNLTLEKKNEIILLHIQLCHPELHEKALDPPGKYCADAEWE